MLIYLQNHPGGAGNWIYRGYYEAWKKEGFEPVFIKSLDEIDSNDYMLMITNGMVDKNNLTAIEKSKKCFMFASPNIYPDPWGQHPNFQCPLDLPTINILNELDNVVKWTFGEVKKEHYTWWNDVITVPLAFDEANYQVADPDNKNYKYDVCFIGGFANNGFNEKIKIMEECLGTFMRTKLKYGFSIGQQISHGAENKVLLESKVCLNIHDAYQRHLGLDTNERTFKSLGVNGLMVSDKVKQLNDLFPDVKTSLNNDVLVNFVLEYVEQDVSDIKKNNIDNIKKNHTYSNRVRKFLEYAN